MSLSLDDIDITDEDVWADHIPHDQFAYLREHAPVFRHPGNTNGARPIEDFWCITRHADVQTVNRDTTLFSSELRGVLVHEPDEDSANFRTMLDTDPPAHTRLRRLVNRGFTPRMVTRFEEHYAQLTADLLAKAVAQGTFDFVTDIAAELPLMAIAELLGVPVEDRHKLFDWSNKLVGNSDPEYVGSADDALNAATELYVYFNLLGEDRRANPRGRHHHQAHHRGGGRRPRPARVRDVLPDPDRGRQRDHPQRHLARDARPAPAPGPDAEAAGRPRAPGLRHRGDPAPSNRSDWLAERQRAGVDCAWVGSLIDTPCARLGAATGRRGSILVGDARSAYT